MLNDLLGFVTEPGLMQAWTCSLSLDIREVETSRGQGTGVWGGLTAGPR